MVAPLAAAAASRLAPAVRSAGGKWMHSNQKGIRSMGSKMLKVSDEKMGKKIEDVAKFSNMSLGVLKTISKGAAKILGFLAKHSPALKQQLVVIGKAFSVMIRPIGDIMARFMRPMAVWVMKVAQKWYAMVTKNKGPGMDDPADKEKAAEDVLEAAKAGGNPEAIQAAQTNLDQIRAAQKSNNTTGGQENPLKKIFAELIPEGMKESLSAIGKTFKELWNIIKEFGLILWDLLGPSLKAMAVIIGVTLVGVLKLVTFVFEGLAFVLKMVGEGLKVVRIVIEAAIYWLGKLNEWVGEKLVQAFTWLVDKLSDVWSWLKDTFIAGWDTLKTTMSNLWDWVKNTFIGVWDDLKTAIENMWDKVKKVIDKINIFKKSKEDGTDDGSSGNAKGGYVDRTGMYKLHAGEQVLTAGETSRNSETKSNVFNTTVNINATINNDMDIKTLAKKLADLNETELRRRVSYF